jgi:hypothetical protein
MMSNEQNALGALRLQVILIVSATKGQKHANQLDNASYLAHYRHKTGS